MKNAIVAWEFEDGSGVPVEMCQVEDDPILGARSTDLETFAP